MPDFAPGVKREAPRAVPTRSLAQQATDYPLDVSVIPIAVRVALFLRFVKLAARMNVADDSLPVDYERHRSPAAFFETRPPAAQGRPFRVEGHRESESKALARGPHPLHVPVTRRFGMKNSDHLKAAVRVL